MASVHLVRALLIFFFCRIASLVQLSYLLILLSSRLHTLIKPWFLDGKLTSNFRGKPHIDGSFLARPSDYFDFYGADKQPPTVILDFKRDPLMKERALELVKVVSKQTIWDILERGKTYGKIMDAQGEFRSLSRYNS